MSDTVVLHELLLFISPIILNLSIRQTVPLTPQEFKNKIEFLEMDIPDLIFLLSHSNQFLCFLFEVQIVFFLDQIVGERSYGA